MGAMRRYDVDALVEDVITLPSMPQALRHILDLLEDPDCRLPEVAKAIAADPGITLKALRLVNSAYYGLGQEVKTVEHAVVLLGVKVIKNLVLTATVFQAMEGAADRFIRHSVGCGVAMRVLAREPFCAGCFESPDEAFVYGLLHDIGKVILDEFLPEQTARVASLVRETGMAWHAAEDEVIGANHAEVGGRLAEKWKLSPVMAGAIGAHHAFSLALPEHQRQAAILSVANFLCGAAGMGSYARPVLEMDASVWECAGLGTEGVPVVVDRFVASLPTIDELILLAA